MDFYSSFLHYFDDLAFIKDIAHTTDKKKVTAPSEQNTSVIKSKLSIIAWS